MPRVIREPQQARERFALRVEVAGLEIVVPVVEHEADAVIEQRSPVGRVHLALRQPRQAVVGRLAVQEDSRSWSGPR